MDKNSIHSLKVSIYLVSCLPTSSCLKKIVTDIILLYPL